MKKVFTTSRINEINALAIRIVALYKTIANLDGDAHLQQLIDLLAQKSLLMTQAINRLNAESELADADQLVNNRVRDLFKLVGGYTHHPDPQVQQAALAVDVVLQTYGLGMVNESYATQTSLVEALLSDLSARDKAAHLKTLSGCDTVIDRLREVQAAFKQVCVAYETQKTADANQPVATNLKRDVLGLINQQLIVYIQAMKQVNPVLYGTFADTVELFIADNNRNVDKRSSKNEKPTEAPKA